MDVVRVAVSYDNAEHRDLSEGTSKRVERSWRSRVGARITRADKRGLVNVAISEKLDADHSGSRAAKLKITARCVLGGVNLNGIRSRTCVNIPAGYIHPVDSVGGCERYPAACRFHNRNHPISPTVEISVDGSGGQRACYCRGGSGRGSLSAKVTIIR